MRPEETTQIRKYRKEAKKAAFAGGFGLRIFLKAALWAWPFLSFRRKIPHGADGHFNPVQVHAYFRVAIRTVFCGLNIETDRVFAHGTFGNYHSDDFTGLLYLYRFWRHFINCFHFVYLKNSETYAKVRNNPYTFNIFFKMFRNNDKNSKKQPSKVLQ